MNFGVGRFALGHLNARDAQRPDVCAAVIANLLDHLGRHPKGCANHLRREREGREEKKGELTCALIKEKRQMERILFC
jgi:hypothetical protein